MPIRDFCLTAEGLTKRFQRREIFTDISFTVHNRQILGIIGRNGSGKSTLIKICGGFLTPTRGTCRYRLAENDIEIERFQRRIGFIAPYLVLYEEFTCWEHLRLASKLRGAPFDTQKARYLLERFRLYENREHDVKTFSSGMKQRMRFVISLLHEPELLLCDEPLTNLDEAGAATLEEVLLEHCAAGGGVIIATNDQRDLRLCQDFVSVDPMTSPPLTVD